MPRRSSAQLAVVKVDGGFNRLKPPAQLGEAERAVWSSIVLACDAKHFQASDAPLVVRYCQNVVLAGLAAEALTREGPVVAGRVNPWLVVAEKADRALVALSMRLRISPQARLRRETAVPKGHGGSVYDLMRDDDD
jgi:phage terminase small subunit